MANLEFNTFASLSNFLRRNMKTVNKRTPLKSFSVHYEGVITNY